MDLKLDVMMVAVTVVMKDNLLVVMMALKMVLELGALMGMMSVLMWVDKLVVH